jgi:hypothetical protein
MGGREGPGGIQRHGEGAQKGAVPQRSADLRTKKEGCTGGGGTGVAACEAAGADRGAGEGR